MADRPVGGRLPAAQQDSPATGHRSLTLTALMLFLAMLSLGSLCWAVSAREDATERLENATNVLHEIMGMPDKGIPEEVLEHAKCIAVVPHMVKGGFVFGGKGGKGVATCRTANGWSAPAFITISGGSWGLQIQRRVDTAQSVRWDRTRRPGPYRLNRRRRTRPPLALYARVDAGSSVHLS